MKGIVLAGGKGTRLYPLTHSISKQILPVYNKPMIFYPLRTLRDMGIKDILIIAADELQCRLFQGLLESLDHGLKLQYKIQAAPNGLPEAFIIGEEFIGGDDVTLILGDNVFILNETLDVCPNTIYTYRVRNPEAYGVVQTNKKGKFTHIVEKPVKFISDQAVVGLYTFTNKCVGAAKNLKPSQRGELEIVDLIRELDREEGVQVRSLNGFWFDCGTHDDLLECSNLVKAIEHRTNTTVGLCKGVVPIVDF